MGQTSGALAGLRIVDAAEFICGPYAARLMSDMGAQVLKVETGQGDGSRRHGPFPPGQESPAHSALFHLMNAGKRIASAEKLEQMLPWLAEADVVICSRGAACGDWIVERSEELMRQHPRLIVAHVAGTPDEWGAASISDCSLHAAALGGVSTVIGDPDKAPLMPPYDLLEYLVGANLAAAVLAAVHARDDTGRGQFVRLIASDVVAHNAMTPRVADLMNGQSAYLRSGRRNTGAMGGIFPWGLYPCQDGYIVLVSHAKKNWQALLSILGNPSWSNDPRFADPQEIARLYADEVDELLCQELQRFTRAQLFEMAKDMPISLGPAQTIRDTLESPHLQARGSMSSLPVGDREIRYIKRPFLLSNTPVPAHSRPPQGLGSGPVWEPRTGRDEPPRTHGWHGANSPARGQGILAGLRVVDFSWNWAGPMVGAALADLGAEVIRLEHRDRLDSARTRARAQRHGKPVEGPIEEVSFYFHQNNRGKFGATFDMKHPEGNAIVRQLLEQADLVIENFTPEVFQRAGLDYATIASKNPSLVWLSMTSAGHFGPLAGIRTYAPVMSALAGIESIIGYDGDEPVGMLAFALGDSSGGGHALVTALAALRHVRCTGRGQFIDFSLTEALMSLLAEPMAEIELSGQEPPIQGMRHHRLVPHGNYPCADDQYIALSVQDAAQWRRLVELVSPDDLARDERLSDPQARMALRLEIDAAITAWMHHQDRDTALGQLHRLGLPATPVLTPDELARHWPQAQRVVVKHPVVGEEWVMQVPWHLSRTPPAPPPRSAPTVGQHTDYVLEKVLGYSQEQTAALMASGATR